MDLLKQLNGALDYIESNLKNHLDKKELSRIAQCSQFEFYRMFSFISGITLGEYIRRRRLSEAAFDIQCSNKKILDIALDYKYDSPEAFSRAFQKIHGVSPSKARSEGITLKSYPRITFNFSIKGDVAMNYRIESKESFKVFGIERMFTLENDSNFKEIPLFWNELFQNGEYKKLDSIGWNKGIEGLDNVNSICNSTITEGVTFPYMIFTFAKDDNIPEEYKVVDVPASTWAIFRSEKHSQDDIVKSIQNLIKGVYSEWLPNNNYTKIDGYELELYFGSGDNCYCETWIRIEK